MAHYGNKGFHVVGFYLWWLKLSIDQLPVHRCIKRTVKLSSAKYYFVVVYNSCTLSIYSIFICVYISIYMIHDEI